MIIYNPNAGKFANEIVSHQAGEFLGALGWDVEVVASTSGPHLTELSRQAAAEKLDAVILSGGDGSIGNAVNGLVGSETALGVLPTGTANVWAQEIGLPKLTLRNKSVVLQEICQALAKSSPKKIDVGVCNHTSFLLWTGIGLDAMIVQESESKRARWKKKIVEFEYGYLVLKNIFSYAGVDYQILIDDASQPIEGRYLMAIASNIRLYAGGHATISPNARLDDGKMDLWLFPQNHWRQSFGYIQRVIKGVHEQDDNIQRIGFRKLRIQSNQAPHIHIDGDPFETQPTIEINVKKQALNVLIPPNAPEHLI